MEASGSARRSIGFVQKCGGSGTVLPRHSTTRVRIVRDLHEYLRDRGPAARCGEGPGRSPRRPGCGTSPPARIRGRSRSRGPADSRPPGRTRRRPSRRRSRPGRPPRPRPAAGRCPWAGSSPAWTRTAGRSRRSLNSAIAQPTGTPGTNRISGMTIALAPSAIFRARSSGSSPCSRRLESQPPHERAEAGRRRRDPAERADGLDVEAARVVEVFRQPEEVEVPGGVAQELRDDQAPGLAEAQEAQPRQILRRAAPSASTDWISPRSSAAELRMAVGREVVAPPPERPGEAESRRSGRRPSASPRWSEMTSAISGARHDHARPRCPR